jgi:hypothetical protein
VQPRTGPLSDAQRQALAEYEARFAEWRAADEAARAAEAVVAAAAEAAAAGAGPAASAEACATAILLRTEANRLRDHALAIVRQQPL